MARICGSLSRSYYPGAPSQENCGRSWDVPNIRDWGSLFTYTKPFPSKKVDITYTTRLQYAPFLGRSSLGSFSELFQPLPEATCTAKTLNLTAFPPRTGSVQTFKIPTHAMVAALMTQLTTRKSRQKYSIMNLTNPFTFRLYGQPLRGRIYMSSMSLSTDGVAIISPAGRVG